MDLSQEERIAALLDGKYTGAERERLLAELVASDDDMEMLGAVAAALREYEEEERGAGATPLHAPVPQAVTAGVVRPRWKPPRVLVGFALAAGLAALILVPRWLQGGVNGPRAVANGLAHADAGIPGGFPGVAGGVQRSQKANRLSTHERVRLGVYLADWELLARSRADTAGRAAGRVAALLETDSTAREIALRFRQLESAGPGAVRLDPDLGDRAAEFGGKPAELGVWLETARVAAYRGDQAFFESKLSRRLLKGEGPGELLRQSAPAQLADLGKALQSAPPVWDLARSSLYDAVELLAR